MGNSRAWIAIDPGAKGALALIDEDENIEIFDYDKDLISMQEILLDWNKRFDVKLVVIEKLNASPVFSKVTCWSLGGNYATWIALVTLTEMPLELVSPKKWQKGLFTKIDGQGKERSLNLCRRRYPKLREQYFKRKMDIDRADALLMAIHGRDSWMMIRKSRFK